MKPAKNSSERQTVMLATLGLDPGGSNEIATTLFRRWPRTSDNVRLCVADYKSENIAFNLRPDWTIGRVPTIKNIVLVCFSIWRMSRVFRPTVIVSHGYGLNHAFLIAKWLRLVHSPLVIVEHGDLDGRFQMQSITRRMLSKTLTRRLYCRADRVVYVSEVLAERGRLARLGTEASIVAIPNCIDRRSLVRRSLVPPKSYDSDFSRPLPRPWVIWMGRLSLEKNPALLVDVMAEFFKTRDGSCLVLGDGPMRSEIENDVRRRGLHTSVRFLGHIPDPAWFTRQADVIALTSRTEGRPLVLLQAMAFGTAIVAPDHIPGVTELLNGYGPARCVSISDPYRWSIAIAELISLEAGQAQLAQNVEAHLDLNAGLADEDWMLKSYTTLIDQVVRDMSYP